MAKFVQSAMKKSGALPTEAKKKGMMKGDAPVTLSALGKMKTEASQTPNDNLAKKLKKIHKY